MAKEIDYIQRSELNMYPTEIGKVECIADNSEGRRTMEAFLRITDIEVSLNLGQSPNRMQTVKKIINLWFC